MTNPKFPISPCTMQQVGDNEFRPKKDRDDPLYSVPHGGLTIREHFASLAMQGLLASTARRDLIAENAVTLADDLIAELNKPINPTL